MPYLALTTSFPKKQAAFTLDKTKKTTRCNNKNYVEIDYYVLHISPNCFVEIDYYVLHISPNCFRGDMSYYERKWSIRILNNGNH